MSTLHVVGTITLAIELRYVIISVINGLRELCMMDLVEI